MAGRGGGLKLVWNDRTVTEVFTATTTPQLFDPQGASRVLIQPTGASNDVFIATDTGATNGIVLRRWASTDRNEPGTLELELPDKGAPIYFRAGAATELVCFTRFYD